MANVSKTFRVPPDVLAKLEGIAQERSESVSKALAYVVRDWVQTEPEPSANDDRLITLLESQIAEKDKQIANLTDALSKEQVLHGLAIRKSLPQRIRAWFAGENEG